MVSLIQPFEAVFLCKVSLKTLNLGIILKTNFNPFQKNGFFLKPKYNSVRMVHCIHWGLTGYNSPPPPPPPPKKKISFSEGWFCLCKQCKADEMYISSGSSLFARVPIFRHLGVSGQQRVYIQNSFPKGVANQINKQTNALASVHFTNYWRLANLLLSREIPLLSLFDLLMVHLQFLCWEIKSYLLILACNVI